MEQAKFTLPSQISIEIGSRLLIASPRLKDLTTSRDWKRPNLGPER